MAHTSMSRRQFLHISGAAVSALALAACVPVSAPAASEGSAAPSGAATVSEDTPLWVLQTSDFYQGYNDFVRKQIVDFAKEKGWALEVADTAGFLGGSADIQKVTAAVQSGDAPDLWMHTVSVFQMKQLGNVVAVTDIVKENVSKYGDVTPRLTKDTSDNGEFYGVPFHVRSDGGWARKDIFDPAGIDVTKLQSYDELRDACLSVSNPDKQIWGWGITCNRGGDGGYLIDRVLTGWGAAWADKSGQYVTIDSPETVTAVKWLVDTYTNSKWEKMLPPGVLSWTDPSNNEAYLGGKVAYTQNAGTVYANAVVNNNPVAPNTLYDVPKGGPVNKSFNGLSGMNWLKIASGKNPDAADEMIRHFFTEDVLRGVYKAAPSYAVPAYQNMWDWDEITSVAQSMAQKPAALDPAGWNGLAYPGPSSAQMAAVENSNLHTDMVASVLTGSATAEDAVKQAAQRSIEIFKEFGAAGTK